MFTVESARALPCPQAAEDVIGAWVEIAGENVALFSGQAIVEAERGDIEAALYASSAAEFASIVCARLRQLRAEIAVLTMAAALAGLRSAECLAATFLI